MPELTYTSRIDGSERVIQQLTGIESKLGKMAVSAKRAGTATKSAFQTLGQDLQRVGGQLESAGRSLTLGLTAPLVGLAGAITFFGSEFEQKMARSQAIMGDLSEKMKADMTDAALQVERTTTFSASQAAEAYFFLASAGLDAAQSVAALPLVAQFAQAGNFELARATDLLTDAQSALGLTIRDDVTKNMENMIRVSDVLVKANTLSNATVAQFSESLTNKAGAALRQVNKDVEEGAAVLAVFADQGVKGSEAGTQFGIVMRDLQTKAIRNSEAFKEYGIQVFDSNEKMLNMADIVGSLETALNGMSDKQKKAILLQAGFADRSVSALLSLIGFSEAAYRSFCNF